MALYLRVCVTRTHWVYTGCRYNGTHRQNDYPQRKYIMDCFYKLFVEVKPFLSCMLTVLVVHSFAVSEP